MPDNSVIAVPGLVIDNPTQYFIDATAARKSMIINCRRDPAEEITKIKAEYHRLKEED